MLLDSSKYQLYRKIFVPMTFRKKKWKPLKRALSCPICSGSRSLKNVEKHHRVNGYTSAEGKQSFGGIGIC